MKNKIKIFFAIMLLVLVFFPMINAKERNVCCNQLEEGGWCQNAYSLDDCVNGQGAEKPCEEGVTLCAKGTCVYEGKCKANVPKLICEQQYGGTHYEGLDPDELDVCTSGCCVYGPYAEIASRAECLNLGSENGFGTNWLINIKTEDDCDVYASSGDVEGACVISSQYETTCKRTNREECTEEQKTSLMGLLKASVSESEVTLNFHAGKLCTAPNLNTNCAKNLKETACNPKDESKIYFKDTCGNLANVYDESKINNAEYWTDIKEENLCSVGAEASSSCGNCDYDAGTVCAEYNVGEKDFMPNSGPKIDNIVCREIGCVDKEFKDRFGRNPYHGEKWCAEIKGLPIIQVNAEGDLEQLYDSDGKTKIEKSDLVNYNLPGSRYVVKSCFNGDITTTACNDMRQEVCKEYHGSTTEEFINAQCWVNNWRECGRQNTSTDCNDNYLDCYWISASIDEDSDSGMGYRFDQKVIKDEEDRIEQQGSCVPLYAPGFEFWEDNDANSICSSAGVMEAAVFETNWFAGLWNPRSEFKDENLTKAGERCIENCYLLPGYGEDSNMTISEHYDLWHGDSVPEKIKSYFLSKRKGYYCHKKKDKTEEKTKIGEVSGDFISCTGEGEKRNTLPEFYTNEQWLTFITTRTSFLGDCGYKKSFNGVKGEEEAEQITTKFYEVKQSGETKKEYDTLTIYKGDRWLENSEYRTDE